MRRFYHPNPQDGSLSPEESKHVRKVLRLGPGDQFEILDGKGNIFLCTISDNSDKQVRYSIDETKSSEKPRIQIHLFVATIKDHSRIEWLVEKAVELGVYAISFYTAARSEKGNVRLPRLESKAIAAMKQSSNPWLPTIDQRTWKEALETKADLKIIGALSDESQSIKNFHQNGGSCAILIGPEGGFVEEEETKAKKQDYQFASLGSYVLRAETAAIVAAHSMLSQL